MTAPWWRTAVIYQLYLRSFADGNGDGVGDLIGARNHLSHIAELGCDAVWLSPIYPSPDDDFGYDVTDFMAVASTLGGDESFRAFLEESHRLGLRVILDLIPNHTSTEHPWFRSSRDPRSLHRDYYVWQEGTANRVPNNWLNTLRRPAWKWDEGAGAWYLHQYFESQADLNWHNLAVHDEFMTILRHWLEIGADGFRIDVAHGLYKDRSLHNNPPATSFDVQRDQAFGQRQVFNTEQPELHPLYRSWRELADKYDALLLGETYILDNVRLARFYGDNDELQLCQNMMFTLSALDVDAMHSVVDACEAVLPDGAQPSYFMSNHDLSRFPTRWANGDDRKIRLALLMLLTLRCTPVLYQGDEIGLQDSGVAPIDYLDQVAQIYPPGRDVARGYIPWSSTGANRGFCPEGVRPWLHVSWPTVSSVDDQGRDPSSTLSHTRGLLDLRRRLSDLRVGTYRSLPAPPGVWQFRRGDATTVVLNGSDQSVTCSGHGRTVFHSAGLGVASATLGSVTHLEPWTGAVFTGTDDEGLGVAVG